jgi:hypothetical protein
MNSDDIRTTYTAFIEAIDDSVAGNDGSSSWGLKFHVSCSAEENAGDTIAEDGFAANDVSEAAMLRYWEIALATAKMIMDSWQDYYPQLILETQA